MISRRVSLWALAGIVALGLAARLCFLFRPIQVDESYTLNEYASRPLLEGLGLYTFPNNHLLNTALVHGFTRWLGPEPWAARLPAFWCGLFIIPVTYAMVGGTCGRLAGLFAAALAAASAPLVNYSTNARGYSFVVLATVLLLWLAGKFRRGESKSGHWVAFVLISALGFFAIPIMLYPFGGIMLALAIDAIARPGRGSLRLDRLIAAGISTFLLTTVFYTPVLLRTGPSSLFANPFVAPLPRSLVQQGLPGSLLAAWRQWILDIPIWLALVLPVPWILGLCSREQRRGGMGRLTLLLLILLSWTLAVAWLQRVIPYDRVWLFLLPVYLGCVGAGLAMSVEALAGHRAGPALRLAAVFALELGLGLLVVRGDGLDRETHQLSLYDADAITQWLKPRLRHRDAVVALSPCDGPLKSSFIRHRVPTEWLHDYWVSRAQRIFIAVERSSGQTVGSVMESLRIPLSPGVEPHLVLDLGDSSLHVYQRGETSGDPK
ncbi:MAG: hypothetical protein ACLP7Q_24955 [Isosphaeraceae bacterium]